MIALPYFNYEVAPGEELRVIGGVSIRVEGEKLGALCDVVVVLISNGIIHVIHQRTSPGEPIKLSR